MKIYKIGIVGHNPNRFKDHDAIKKLCHDTVLKLHYQYDYIDNFYFNINCDTGVGQWCADACVELNIKFNVCLPCPAHIYSQYWYDNQKENLDRLLEMCNGLTIMGPQFTNETRLASNKYLVDSSDFIVCFWEKCHQGNTFETIKYAVENSKIVLNAADNLTMVFKEQLVSKKRK